MAVRMCSFMGQVPTDEAEHYSSWEASSPFHPVPCLKQKHLNCKLLRTGQDLLNTNHYFQVPDTKTCSSCLIVVCSQLQADQGLFGCQVL